jgi:inorganic phosphate transporter, PiT family
VRHDQPAVSTLTLLTLVAVVAAVIFAITGGIHDTANIAASGIASGALRPRHAVVIVAVFGFCGPFVLGVAVADTIGSVVAISDLAPVTALVVVICGLGGAVAWNVVTGRLGTPSSSSLALVGGLVGATIVAAGPSHVVWGVAALADGQLIGVMKAVTALVVSPLVGFAVAFIVSRAARRVLAGATPTANRVLRRGEVVACAALAFAHGANEAQKTMGVIALALLLRGGYTDLVVPPWVVLVSAACVSFGALTGGWRVVRTLGFKIYRVRPLSALDSQLTSAVVIAGASLLGGPVSTTQVVTASVVGVGASERPRAVNWQATREIAVTWIVTLPCAGVAGAALFLVVEAARRMP